MHELESTVIIQPLELYKEVGKFGNVRVENIVLSNANTCKR